MEYDTCTLAVDPDYVPSDPAGDTAAPDTAAPIDRPGGTVACSGVAIDAFCL